jgi:cytochrome c2
VVGGVGSCFTHSYSDAREKQCSKTASLAAQHRHQTPQRYGNGNDGATVVTFCQPCHRDAQYSVQQGERQTAQQRKLGITEPEFGFDRLQQYSQNLQIDKTQQRGSP